MKNLKLTIKFIMRTALCCCDAHNTSLFETIVYAPPCFWTALKHAMDLIWFLFDLVVAVVQHESLAQLLWESGIGQCLQQVSDDEKVQCKDAKSRSVHLLEVLMRRHVAVCMGLHRRLGARRWVFISYFALSMFPALPS